MTLSRQLIMLIVALILVLFLGTFAISVYNARDYLESQLGSHAQDAATSLGLSATSHIERKDQAMVTAMVNAMFHRGDYLSIRFEDLDGASWIERVAEVQPRGVPRWFLTTFTLRPPQRSATMMSGWRQVGTVLVTSHPGLAYEQLWQTAKQTLNLFLLAALVVLALAILGLRALLRPLKAVEMQAEAICNREFPTVEARPFTLEFRHVVEAMNRLSAKVARMLSESENTAGRLRQQAFQDPVTGLANRRQFMDVLQHRIAEPEIFESGGLLLVRLRDLKAFNQAEGYAIGDRLLADAAARLNAAVEDQPRVTLAHLAGADFAVLLEGIDEPQLRELAEQIAAVIAGLYSQYSLPSSDVGHVGGAPYNGQSASELLAEADSALREAQREGANAWTVHRRAASVESTRSGSEWRAVLEGLIDEQRFSLVKQAVVARGGDELLHHEVFLRIPDPDRPGREIAAAVFMPVAEGVGFAPLVDRAVVERVVLGLEAGAFPSKVAINISPLSLAEPSFVDWLFDTLRGHPLVSSRVIIELPEYGASGNVDCLQAAIDRLSPLGVEFSLDHFGKGFASFAYLRSLKAHYIKIDGSFVRSLEQQDDSQFFIKSIADIAHGLDMVVVADSVETDVVWQTLLGMGVDGGRGFLFGRPE